MMFTAVLFSGCTHCNFQLSLWWFCIHETVKILVLLGHTTWEINNLSLSVQFSRLVVSKYLPPHDPQHDRPPCPSPTPRVHPNPCPLSQWCHPAISSSVVPFSSCPQSFPESGSFQMSQLFASGGQSTGVSASASVLPMNWNPRTDFL